VAFDGVDDVDAAQALVGATLSVARDAVTMAADEYFDDDLIGCQLVDEDGTALGTVRAVEHHGAQDVLVVGERRAMVPLVRAFVRAIDVDAKRITVALPPGLLDPAAAEEA